MQIKDKSIYDPCPYGYRTPTNGTYNDFNSNSEWTKYSYDAGLNWGNLSWLSDAGCKSPNIQYVGDRHLSWMSSIATKDASYSIYNHFINRHDWAQIRAFTLRCIEDATVKADQSEASASRC